MQTAGVVSWTKELLVQRCITDLKQAVVVDYETDGNHVGKYVRVGECISSIHWFHSEDSSVSEGASSAAKKRKSDGWTSMTSLPPSCDVVGCTSDTVMLKLGEKDFAKKFLNEMRSRIRDNGLLFTTLLDSGAIYRRIKVEGKNGTFQNQLFTLSLHDNDNDSDSASNERMGPLSLTVGGCSKFENLTLLNLSVFLRLCEAAGFEVVSCINVVEFVYTYFDVHPHSKLLHSYGVWRNSTKIAPCEKQLMELYTTLILRKKEFLPERVWNNIKQSSQSIEEDSTADEYLVMNPYVDSDKEDDMDMDVDIPWGI